MMTRSTLDREAREHQATLESQRRADERSHQVRTLAAALHGELASLNRQYNNYMLALPIQIALFKAMFDSGTRNTTHEFVFFSAATPVYNANIIYIGILGPSVASDVFEVYGYYQTGLRFSSGTDIKLILSVLEHLYGNLSEVNADANHLGSRLVAIQLSSPLPDGIFYERQRRRASAKATVTTVE